MSSIRNSKESNSSYTNSNNIIKNKIKENDFYEDLELQIKDSLKKLSEQYYQYDNKQNFFNYYCSPFIYNSHNRRDFYFVNRYKENDDNNNKCPFAISEDK